MLSAIKQFNWLDIFVLIVLLRTGYVSRRTGFSIELFKLLGTILAACLSLHYYIIFSDYIGERIGVNNIPLEYLTSAIFVALALLGYFIFVVLRSIFYRFMTMEAAPNLNKWGGLILGLGRGVLLASLITFIFVTSPADYLKRSVTGACSGKHLFKIAPGLYNNLWSRIISKFLPQEKFNPAILDIQKILESGE